MVSPPSILHPLPNCTGGRNRPAPAEYQPPLPFSPPPAEYQPWIEAPGTLLELYETTLTYPQLPNVDLTLLFADESGPDLKHIRESWHNLVPVICAFKGDKNPSCILAPNAAHYR